MQTFTKDLLRISVELQRHLPQGLEKRAKKSVKHYSQY